jgi:hypothetical protein
LFVHSQVELKGLELLSRCTCLSRGVISIGYARTRSRSIGIDDVGYGHRSGWEMLLHSFLLQIVRALVQCEPLLIVSTPAQSGVIKSRRGCHPRHVRACRLMMRLLSPQIHQLHHETPAFTRLLRGLSMQVVHGSRLRLMLLPCMSLG